jgi:hypothetical protein
MDIEFAKALAEAAETDGILMTVHAEYSGRGMYGQQTAAVVCDSWRDFAAAVALLVSAREGDLTCFDGPNVVDQIKRFSSDSMGRDSLVIY